MKRSPLRRRSLKRTLDAKRRTEIREQVFARDLWRCRVLFLSTPEPFRAFFGCHGPLTPHHRRKASQGGAYSLANLVTLCQFHNDLIEADADFARWAHEVGLVVKRGDPEWHELGE